MVFQHHQENVLHSAEIFVCNCVLPEAAKKSFSSRWSRLRMSSSGKASAGASGRSPAGGASSSTASKIGTKLTQWVNPVPQQVGSLVYCTASGNQ